MHTKKFTRSRRLIKFEHATRKIYYFFELVLPNWVIHLLKLSEVVFNDALLILFI